MKYLVEWGHADGRDPTVEVIHAKKYGEAVNIVDQRIKDSMKNKRVTDPIVAACQGPNLFVRWLGLEQDYGKKVVGIAKPTGSLK